MHLSTRTVRNVLGTGLFLALLTACGAIIGPQAATDPFGLDGTEVSVQFGAGFTSMAVSGSANSPFTFPDFDEALPLSPKTIENEIGMASAVLDNPDGPPTITIESATLTVQIWHDAADYDSAAAADRTQFSLSTTGSVVLTRSGCDADGCTYDVSGVTLGTLNLTGGPLASFINVATNPPSPNQGQATLVVEAQEDELAGSTLTVVLAASEGTLRF